MKMYELFNAVYSNGETVWEKTLDEIYDAQGENRVTITPVIRVYRPAHLVPYYFVDYANDSVGVTLEVFDTYREAILFCESVSQMDETNFKKWLLSRENANQETL